MLAARPLWVRAVPCLTVWGPAQGGSSSLCMDSAQEQQPSLDGLYEDFGKTTLHLHF